MSGSKVKENGEGKASAEGNKGSDNINLNQMGIQ
jgi:hypothetical protein